MAQRNALIRLNQSVVYETPDSMNSILWLFYVSMSVRKTINPKENREV